jgi:general secretion pathway protein H
MIVVAIAAMATAGVSLALRDTAQAQLETEGMRLAALLDSARGQSRASGVSVHWQPTAEGFRFEGLEPTHDSKGAATLSSRWQGDGMAASVERPLLLGPEPLIAPQQVKLWRTEQPDKPIWLVTDGVRPFVLQNTAR